MFKYPVFLTLAAMCCGAPATVVAVVMLPWAIVAAIAAIAAMPAQPMLAAFNLLLVMAALYALGSYWLLAAKTIKGRTFKRGWPFWAACAAALFAVFDAFPLGAAAAVAGPIILATAACLHAQRAIARRNAAQPFAPADGFAAR